MDILIFCQKWIRSLSVNHLWPSFVYVYIQTALFLEHCNCAILVVVIPCCPWPSESLLGHRLFRLHSNVIYLITSLFFFSKVLRLKIRLHQFAFSVLINAFREFCNVQTYRLLKCGRISSVTYRHFRDFDRMKYDAVSVARDCGRSFWLGSLKFEVCSPVFWKHYIKGVVVFFYHLSF